MLTLEFFFAISEFRICVVFLFRHWVRSKEFGTKKVTVSSLSSMAYLFVNLARESESVLPRYVPGLHGNNEQLSRNLYVNLTVIHANNSRPIFYSGHDVFMYQLPFVVEELASQL